MRRLTGLTVSVLAYSAMTGPSLSQTHHEVGYKFDLVTIAKSGTANRTSLDRPYRIRLFGGKVYFQIGNRDEDAIGLIFPGSGGPSSFTQTRGNFTFHYSGELQVIQNDFRIKVAIDRTTQNDHAGDTIADVELALQLSTTACKLLLARHAIRPKLPELFPYRQLSVENIRDLYCRGL